VEGPKEESFNGEEESREAAKGRTCIALEKVELYHGESVIHKQRRRSGLG
jgi:hypothetical protein